MDKDFTKGQDVMQPSEQASAVEKPRPTVKPSVGYVSDEHFRKAHKKVIKTHAGLFRRLAQ